MAASTSSNTVTNASNPQRIQSLKAFLASDEPIIIVPSFNYKAPLAFLLTQTSVGPFHAGVNTTVPLWLGVYLRKRNLCRLVAPIWMNEDTLKDVLAHERKEDDFSKDLPFRYMEIARTVLQSCGAGRSQVHATGGDVEEIPKAEQIRVLLEDIGTVRMDKIRRNVHALSAETMGSRSRPMPVLDVTGIGAIEMAAVKPFLEGAFEDHLRLIKAGTIAGNGNGPENEEGAAAPPVVSRSRVRRYR
mmetsp:Transcript_25999/g.30642  ORF Transcript_25999/g.30642 Transcript_25999/m.30642 type:complete len:245 (-) Transcript_25999:125-859(-)|eukprot:CAMPEP_0198262362 /NCGR_PEP_ID=MMETSP1447-20131203/10881_1 /TAXON_ID=420782 /ORGANISM="Chaetoceros dichaeta, Strain CCMP1751" /LENGTH=244 /DNA_ID=CAMNT_0043950567 /DNA_START=32 /DNA_END=766 /DNA_ORIENTATION=-